MANYEEFQHYGMPLCGRIAFTHEEVEELISAADSVSEAEKRVAASLSKFSDKQPIVPYSILVSNIKNLGEPALRQADEGRGVYIYFLINPHDMGLEGIVEGLNVLGVSDYVIDVLMKISLPDYPVLLDSI